MKRLFAATFLLLLVLAPPARAQSDTDVLREAVSVYTGRSADGASGGGFSAAGLIGGMLFSSIGFVAFIYGKRNSFVWPMVLGAALMGCPFVVRGTLWLYVVGTALTAALFVLRE